MSKDNYTNFSPKKVILSNWYHIFPKCINNFWDIGMTLEWRHKGKHCTCLTRVISELNTKTISCVLNANLENYMSIITHKNKY
jgi:hypothetical protein